MGQKIEEERPLDRYVNHGGLTRIFRTIGCIGDSLSSGEFQIKNENGINEYYDMYEYSWGQHIARMTGSTIYNFSRGGMSAKTYMEGYADKNGFWSPQKFCQAYIIALGVNDLRIMEVGSVSDIDPEDYRNNKKTFAGYYAAIIQRIRLLQPKAKIFMVTIPREDPDAEADVRDKHRELLCQMEKMFDHTYLVDLRTYAPVYDRAFKEMYFMNQHMNPAGYVYTADMMASYIDYIIRHNSKEFNDVGFIGWNVVYPKM